jgi:hypothetical protein
MVYSDCNFEIPEVKVEIYENTPDPAVLMRHQSIVRKPRVAKGGLVSRTKAKKENYLKCKTHLFPGVGGLSPGGSPAASPLLSPSLFPKNLGPT